MPMFFVARTDRRRLMGFFAETAAFPAAQGRWRAAWYAVTSLPEPNKPASSPPTNPGGRLDRVVAVLAHGIRAHAASRRAAANAERGEGRPGALRGRSRGRSPSSVSMKGTGGP